MSHHFSAAYLKFPGDDARLDLYAAFSAVFTRAEEGRQVGTVSYATGDDARRTEPAGEVIASAVPVAFDAAAHPVYAGDCELFMGVRGDPSFADAEGALHGFDWTGEDSFAGKDVQCIALQVPDDLLGPDPAISVRATVSVRHDGTPVQVDRGGNPTINPFINPDYAKDRYNAGHPADDVATYLQPWSKLLQENGCPAAEATEAAARMSFPTQGKVTSDGLSPHDDVLTEFPHLGPPHR